MPQWILSAASEAKWPATNIRVQTLVIAATTWGMTPAEIAADCGLPRAQVENALQFYQEHRLEIDAAIAAETELERQANPNKTEHG